MLNEALACLRAGGVVAAATESFVGLFADARNPAAISALLSIKPRGHDKGMPLVMSAIEQWSLLVAEVPPLARHLAERFWPGPLSIALPALAGVDDRLPLDGSIAVRIPGDSPAAWLVNAFGGPLTATSANPPGAAPTADPSDVARQFAEPIARGALVVLPERGPARPMPSSVVVVTGSELRVVRVGAVPLADIERVSKEL